MAISPALTETAEAGESVTGVDPIALGVIAFVLLAVLLLGVLMFGKGRPHS